MNRNKITIANKVAEGTGTGAAVLGGITLIIVSIILIPLLIFWVGYFLGWLSTFVCGDALVKGINSFGLHITVNDIPPIAGALCWIGWLFHSKTGIEKES